MAAEGEEEGKALREVEEGFRKELEGEKGGDMLTLCAYAHLLADTGREEQARAFFQRAIEAGKEKKSGSSREALALAMGWYAVLLESSGQPDDFRKASELYDEAHNLHPRCPLVSGNRAMHLHRAREDIKFTEDAYEQAIDSHPRHSSVLCKYGSFQKHMKQDRRRAQSLFEAAIQANPYHEESLGNLAVLLHGEKRDSNIAEEMYERALRCNPRNVNTLSNFGLFLSEVRTDHARAEELYKRATALDPHHANSIYNYAVLLDSGLQDYSRAEEMYRRCLRENPRHGFALYNLAVLMEEHTNGNFSEAKCLFQRAIEANPSDSIALADFGRFLATVEHDYDGATALLKKALKQDARCATALYNLAKIVHAQHGNAKEAGELLRRAVDAKPDHAGAHHYLALLLMEGKSASGKQVEIESHFTVALKHNPSNAKLRADYDAFRQG